MINQDQGFPTFFVSRNTLDLKKFRGTSFKKISSEVVCFSKKIVGNVGLRSPKMTQITKFKPLKDGDSELLYPENNRFGREKGLKSIKYFPHF